MLIGPLSSTKSAAATYYAYSITKIFTQSFSNV